VEKYGTARRATDHNIIRRMRFTCWLMLQTHTQNMLILIAFPPQQGLCDRASRSRYTSTASCFSIQPRPHRLS